MSELYSMIYRQRVAGFAGKMSPKKARARAEKSAAAELRRIVIKHGTALGNERPHLRLALCDPKREPLWLAWAELQEMGPDASDAARELVEKAPEFRPAFARATAAALYGAIMGAVRR